MAYKGRYIPKNLDKYKGDPSKIIWRSTWERKFMEWCDMNPNVLEWNSEGVQIPYISPVDGKWHRYFVDFWVRVRTKSGSVVDKLVEIKPHKETQAPKKPRTKRQSARYLREARTYAINQAKWAAAREVAENNSMEFVVLDEYSLGIKPRK